MRPALSSRRPAPMPTSRPSGRRLGSGRLSTSPPSTRSATGTTGLIWIITAPIVGTNGASQGTVAGDLLVAKLERTPGSPNPKTRRIHVANSDHLLVLSSDWGPLTERSGPRRQGALSARSEVSVVNQALTAGAGFIAHLGLPRSRRVRGLCPDRWHRTWSWSRRPTLPPGWRLRITWGI